MLIADPNLFTWVTTIKFKLAETGKATLKIYDLQGREITTLINGQRKAGEVNSVMFDTSKLPAGVYLCHLQNNNSSATVKLILLN